MPPADDRLVSEEEFNAMPADMQASLIEKAKESSLPSNQPILQDIANSPVSNAIIPGMGTMAGLLDKGLNYYSENINPIVQSGIQDLKSAVPYLMKMPGMGMEAPLVMSALGTVAGAGSEMIESPTRGDVARGVGGAAGAAAGSPGGIPGMMLGGAGGQNLADSAVRLIDGNYGDKTWTDTAIQSGMGAMNAFGMHNPGNDVVRKELTSQIAEANYSAGLNKIVAMMGPTGKDAAMQWLPEAASLKNSLKELIENYGFKVDSLDSIQSQIHNLLGGELKNGTRVPGQLRSEINASARALDQIVPPRKFSEDLGLRLQQYQNDVAESLTFLPEKDTVLKNLQTRINAVKDGFVPPETIAERDAVQKEFTGLNNQIAQLDTRIASKKSKSQIANLTSTRNELQGKADEALGRLKSLQAEIDDPQINFEGLAKARDQVDEVAKTSFGKEEVGILPGKIKDLANTLREHEDGLANFYTQQGVLPQEVAGDYLSLKRQYHLLKEVEPGFNKISQAAAADPGISREWKSPSFYLQARPTGLKPTAVGGFTGRNPAEKTIQKELGNLDQIVQSQGKQMPGMNAKATARLALNTLVNQTSAANAARNIPMITAERNLGSYLKNSNALEDLKHGLFISAVKNFGIPIGPQGLDLSQVPPEIIQQANGEVQQMSKMLEDAINMGDEEDQGIALTKLAKIAPDAFAEPKSGIKGEVIVGGKKLYDPIDRAKYTEQLRQNKALSFSEKASKISQLNDDYTIN